MNFKSEFSSLVRKVAFAKMSAERSGREVRIKITSDFYAEFLRHIICYYETDPKSADIKFMGCNVEIADKIEVAIVEIVK